MNRLAWAIMAATAAAPALAQTDAQLRMVCKQFIERQLHDPRSADLDWANGRIGQDKTGNRIVEIVGRVNNQAGGRTLATFQCTVGYTAPDNFRSLGVKVVR